MDGLIINVKGCCYSQLVDLGIAIRDRGVDVHIATPSMEVLTPDLGMWSARRAGYKVVVFTTYAGFVTVRSLRHLADMKTFPAVDVDAIANFICEANDRAA